MGNLRVQYLLPVFLASMLIVGGCQEKADVETIAVEEVVTQDHGMAPKEWVVEQIVPIPQDKADTVAGIRPSTEHIWVPGSWERTGTNWDWKPGRWDIPPHGQAKWLKGHWGWVEGKWHWKPAYWIDGGDLLIVKSIIEAPALIPETVPDKPSDKNHWVAGYWDWDGHWLWIPGYWTNKPDPDAVWVPGHWENYGLDAGFRWISCHWAIEK